MPRYETLEKSVLAVRWNPTTPHPEVWPCSAVRTTWVCPTCKGGPDAHGQVDRLDGSVVVCNGDWVVSGLRNGAVVIPDEVFSALFKAAAVDPSQFWRYECPDCKMCTIRKGNMFGPMVLHCPRCENTKKGPKLVQMASRLAEPGDRCGGRDERKGGL